MSHKTQLGEEIKLEEWRRASLVHLIRESAEHGQPVSLSADGVKSLHFLLTTGETARSQRDELLYAVGKAYHNESRYETALRYIQQAEISTGPAQEQRP